MKKTISTIIIQTLHNSKDTLATKWGAADQVVFGLRQITKKNWPRVVSSFLNEPVQAVQESQPLVSSVPMQQEHVGG